MIEISHLTKKYGNHVAVDDLNLTMEPGKIYGFLGPNGAGKTTTMNMMTGYLGATGGTVKINGFDIFEQPEEAKKCVGYLPELPPLYQEMTVLEYLNFAAELKKIEKAERKIQVEEVMEMTGIWEMRNRLIRNLSKGYKQRVGLAQAILGYPEVILLDEPTVGLDPKQIIEMRELIKELGQDHTVILSSHILTEISAVCDHIFIISKGKLVASDSTENLSHLMEGAPEIHMEIKGEKDAIKGVLKKMRGIASYHVTEEEEETKTGLCQVMVEVKNSKAGRKIDDREKDMEEPVDIEEQEVAAGAEEMPAVENEEQEILTPEEIDMREQLFYAFAEAKMPIYSMNTEGKSLEDVFLELTQQAGGEA